MANVANEWEKVSEGFVDWKVEMRQHLNKFRVVRTHGTEWVHTSYVICSEHAKFSVKFKVQDFALTGINSLYKLTEVAHLGGQGPGLSHDIMEIVEPLKAAELPPKVL